MLAHLLRSLLACNLLVPFVLLAAPAESQPRVGMWTPNGVAICTEPGEQGSAVGIPDGQGGSYLVWQDRRSGSTYDLYGIRIDGLGQPVPGWDPGGIVLCDAAGDQLSPRIASDGNGGAFVVWSDTRGAYSATFVQHVLPTGTPDPAWPADGLHVTPLSAQFNPEIAADGLGGIVLAWQDVRDNSTFVIYAHRLNASGSPPSGWPTGGVALTSSGADNFDLQIASDQAGGAFVSWRWTSRPCSGHGCSPNLNGTQLSYVTEGVKQWVTSLDGVFTPMLATDGNGGVIVAHGMPFYLTCQPYSVSGSGGWAAQFDLFGGYVNMAGDGMGGTFYAWEGGGNGNDIDLVAGKLTATGSHPPGWPSNGIALCGAPGNQGGPKLVPDQQGGCFFAWLDLRASTFDSTRVDIFATRISESGTEADSWTTNGNPVCDAPGSQFLTDMFTDTAGGAVLVWEDQRGSGVDIYAQRLGPDIPVAAAVSLLSADADSGRIRLVWQESAGMITSATVYRRQEGAAWEALGVVDRSGTGLLTYQDGSIRPATRYFYRLGYYDDGDEQFTEEFVVETPALALALHGTLQNPVRGPMHVSFSLASGNSAMLSIWDVRGRRLWAQEIGSLGAGSHTLNPETGNLLRSGVYWLRLEQDRQVVSRKVVLLP
jgi:hypothetical protein